MQGREVFLLQAVPRECLVGRWFILWLWSMVLYQHIASHSSQQGLRYPGSLELCSTLGEESGFGWSIRESQHAVPHTSGIQVAERGVEVGTAQSRACPWPDT